MDLVPDYEVVVLGGGPAGCAAALALCRRGISGVLLVEAGRYEASRVGESIPPNTGRRLQELGVWDAFLKEEHDTCPGSCSSWGDETLGYNDFLFNPYGNGWHLDRTRFDAFLASQAEQHGAELRTGLRFEAGERLGNDGFRLRLRGDDDITNTVRARFVVDATGMRGLFARRLGANRHFLDRLICVYGFFERTAAAPLSKLTMLEAVEYGWWYAARLPNERLTAAVATDPEVIKQAGLRTPQAWLAWLAQTNHIANHVSGCRFIEDSLQVYPALSFLLDPVAGDRWLAVGDAASAYDPISSQGIDKALSDGLLAAEVIAAWLGGDVESLGRYPSAVATRFEGYLENRNYFYGLEKRWPASRFWKRRRERVDLSTDTPS